MENTRIVLTGLWAALMFTYLLGDVLRVYNGDVILGELFGQKASQLIYLGIAAFMFVPILMMVLNLLFTGNILRCINLIVTLLYFSSISLVFRLISHGMIFSLLYLASLSMFSLSGRLLLGISHLYKHNYRGEGWDS